MSPSGPEHSNGLVDPKLSGTDFRPDNPNAYPTGHMSQRYASKNAAQSPMTKPMMSDPPVLSRVHSVPAAVKDSFKPPTEPSAPSSHHPTTPVMGQNSSNHNGHEFSGTSSAPPAPSDTEAFANTQDMHFPNKEANQQDPEADEAKLHSGQGHANAPVSAAGMYVGPGGPSAANANVSFHSQHMIDQQEISAKIFKRNLGNAGVMRILDLIDLISSEPHSSLASLDFWVRLCETYASPSAQMRIIMPPNEQSSPEIKSEPGSAPIDHANSYRLNAATIPQFCVMATQDRDVSNYHLVLSGIKFQVLNNGSVFMASHFVSSFTYTDGSKGVVSGDCRILLNREFKIGSIEFKVVKYESSMTIGALENMWNKAEANQEGMDSMKTILAECKSERLAQSVGLNQDALRLLRTSDIMCSLSPLMNFGMANNISSPLLALKKYVSMGGHNTKAPGPMGPNDTFSPSPKTMTAGDGTKKRRSSSVQSPMSSGPISSEHKRKVV